jgi:nucleoside-diphosphate-sugar epimerase
MTIAVAGASGNLGRRIADAIAARGGNVRALVRDAAKAPSGADVAVVDFSDSEGLARALEGVSCVVSVMQGLRDVIVETQTRLLAAATAAGVKRMIPSDFASDFTKTAPGDNRNFDLRREFGMRLDAQSAVAPTTILNGAFAEILGFGTPLLNPTEKSVGYWGDADWRMDFTAIADIAAFTAAAALDPATPRYLRIAGFQVSPTELAAKTSFTLKRMGSTDDLAAYSRRERAAHPEGEDQLMPSWQRSQYIHSMLTTQLSPLDNARYDMAWTSLETVLGRVLAAV